jgi:hypothetical protein
VDWQSAANGWHNLEFRLAGTAQPTGLTVPVVDIDRLKLEFFASASGYGDVTM